MSNELRTELSSCLRPEPWMECSSRFRSFMTLLALIFETDLREQRVLAEVGHHPNDLHEAPDEQKDDIDLFADDGG